MLYYLDNTSFVKWIAYIRHGYTSTSTNYYSIAINVKA